MPRSWASLRWVSPRFSRMAFSPIARTSILTQRPFRGRSPATGFHNHSRRRNHGLVRSELTGLAYVEVNRRHYHSTSVVAYLLAFHLCDPATSKEWMPNPPTFHNIL